VEYSRGVSLERPETPSAGEPVTLRLDGVVRGFDSPAGRVTALKGVWLDASAGDFVALVGKSGSGKSVLLRLMAGLDRPTGGAVYATETRLDTMSDAALTAWRHQHVGILTQDHRLFESLSVLDNVRLPMDLAGRIPRPERAEEARERLGLVGMLNFAESRPSALSLGQQRRVMLAQALANDPPLLIADEPTAGLDPVRATAVFGLFGRLAEAGRCVVMATRDYDLAMRAGRMLVLSDGQIVSQHIAEALPALGPLELSAAAERFRPLRYSPGQLLVRQGDRADRFYIILRGEADVLIERPDGEPVLLNRLGPGQYFGEIGVLHGGKRTATVRASADTGLDVVSLGKDALVTLLDGNEATHEQLQRSIHERLLANTAIA
jgi:putative ABC transport system ATP-binding protein